MSSEPPGARKARAEREERHQRELDEVRRSEAAALEKAEQALAVLDGERRNQEYTKEQLQTLTRWWKESISGNNKLRFQVRLWQCITGVVMCATIIICIVMTTTPSEWRTDTAPVEVKLKVVTYGWYNKKGEWQAYDNGEVITVKQWKPE